MNNKIKGNMGFRVFIGLLLGMFLVVGCKHDEKIPDVSDVKIDFQMLRFDSLYYNTDSAGMTALYDLMHTEHPGFLLGFVGSLTSPTTRVKDTVDFLHAMQHHGMVRIFDTTAMIFKDLSKEREDFTQALRYLKYYFPNKQVPRIYTYISEFGLASFISEDENGREVLASSLDLYLGADFPGYDPMIFPQYMKRSMNREHLVSKTMKALTDDLAGKVQGEQFLDYIITNGKSLYFLEHFLPMTPDSILIRYTTEQMNWCDDNQFNMWSHFIHEELLYSTNRSDFRKLITPSPNATGMPPEAPGRTGNYMGWQIIKAYMKRYPKTTFSELMNLKDSKKILKKSKFKPKAR